MVHDSYIVLPKIIRPSHIHTRNTFEAFQEAVAIPTTVPRSPLSPSAQGEL
jgi:hypothetical protein